MTLDRPDRPARLIDGRPILEGVSTAASTGEAAFERQFRRLFPDVVGLVHRVLGDRAEAEDVAQEVFLRLADAGDVLGQVDAAVAAWTRRVGLNLAFNRLRDRARAEAREQRAGRLQVAVDALAGEASSPISLVVKREQQALVRLALAQLPERQRACLLLRHSGYAYTEIAQTLDLATGSVGVLLARAERAFRTAYRALECGDDETKEHDHS